MIINDIQKITVWVHKWKMIFNPGKTDKFFHMPSTFYAIPVTQTSHQKHLSLYLDEKLNFNHHYKRRNLQSK